MALALPLQGMAAVARLHCGGATPAVVVHEHHDHVHHDPAHRGHSHHDHAQVHSGAAADEASAAALPQPHAQAGGHTCSACAVCCAGLGLPAAITLLPEPDLANVPVMAAGQPAFHFIASGPERPPRSDLA